MYGNVCGLARARRTAAAGLARTAAASTTGRAARPPRPPRSLQVCTRIRTTRPNTSPPTTLTRSGPPPKRPLTRSSRHPLAHIVPHRRPRDFSAPGSYSDSIQRNWPFPKPAFHLSTISLATCPGFCRSRRNLRRGALT